MVGEDIKKEPTKPASTPTEQTPTQTKIKIYPKKLVLGGVGLIFLMLVFGYFVPMPWSWIIILGLMIFFFGLLGRSYGELRWSKILIDDRKQMSLSRFQLVLWTLVILSAYLAIVLGRIHAIDITDPSASAALQSAMIIAMPWQLIALLGISLTAVAGTSLILGTKKGIELTPDRASDIQDMLDKKNRRNEGTVCENKEIKDANFTDMFKGDEVADCATINMAKVQMFFFTIVIVVAYSLIILNLMIVKPPVELAFPEFSQELVTVLGLSNAGYLTEKAVPSTKTNVDTLAQKNKNLKKNE